MLSHGGVGAGTSRRRMPGTQAAIDSLVASARDDPDKALVMAHIGRLVAAGFAVWDMLDNGDVEVRFTSGETYLLAESAILRIV